MEGRGEGGSSRDDGAERRQHRGDARRRGSRPLKTLLIVWHSATGGTRQMAEAAAHAASDPDVMVRLLHARDAVADDMLAADGYLFATPENLAALAGVTKDFFDRVYYPVLDR